MTSGDWQTLGAVAAHDLTDTRLAAHYAAQPMTAAAYGLIPLQEDHSHANLLWSEARHGFVGRPLPGGNRCFLDLKSLRTGLATPAGEDIAVVDLPGKTLDEALAAMAELLREAGVEMPPAGLAVPEYDLPSSPVSQGRPFAAPNAPAMAELARWFGNGAATLTALAAERFECAEVRGWPHHFDVAILRVLDRDSDAENARSVGVGLSPGDGNYAEPYFYVSPWPYPQAVLPALPGGARWHTEGFTSAILSGSEVLAAGGSTAQHERVCEVLQASVDACLALLESR